MSKSLHSLIRVHEWDVDEKRRKLGELLNLVAELEDQARSLEAELKKEQAVANSDPTLAGFHYDDYAKSVIQRRARLKSSIEQTEILIDKARDDLNAAYRVLKTYETAQANRVKKQKLEDDRRDQAVLDEIGLQAHARRRAS